MTALEPEDSSEDPREEEYEFELTSDTPKKMLEEVLRLKKLLIAEHNAKYQDVKDERITLSEFRDYQRGEFRRKEQAIHLLKSKFDDGRRRFEMGTPDSDKEELERQKIRDASLVKNDPLDQKLETKLQMISLEKVLPVASSVIDFSAKISK